MNSQRHLKITPLGLNHNDNMTNTIDRSGFWASATSNQTLNVVMTNTTQKTAIN